MLFAQPSKIPSSLSPHKAYLSIALRCINQKSASAEGDADGEEGKEGGRDPSNGRAEAKYGGDSETAAAAKSSARARAANLGDSSMCEAEVI